MLAFSNDYYGMIFRATQSVELFCAYQKEEFSESATDMQRAEISMEIQKEERKLVEGGNRASLVGDLMIRVRQGCSLPLSHIFLQHRAGDVPRTAALIISISTLIDHFFCHILLCRLLVVINLSRITDKTVYKLIFKFVN